MSKKYFGFWPWNGLILFALLSSCGSGGGGSANSIHGTPIKDSNYSGLAFTAKSADSSYPGTNLYYYNFSDGEIKELLISNARDAVVFWLHGRLAVFNRSQSGQTVQFFDPGATPPALTSELALPDLLAGDPWDVLEVDAARYLIAAPNAGKIFLSTKESPEQLATLSSTFDLPSGVRFRPASMMKSSQQSSEVFVIHQGVAIAGDQIEFNGSQGIFGLKVGQAGAIEPISIGTTSSSGLATGLHLSASTAARFNNVSASTALVAGLCTDSNDPKCSSGVDRFNAGDHKIAALNNLGAANLNFLGQTMDGPTDDAFYVHAMGKSGADEDVAMLLRVEAAQGSATKIHSFIDEQLYGVFFDRSGKNLFVGGSVALQGKMYVYKDERQVGVFELPMIPYSGAFVPK